ncbi:MAG: ribbon-helix-helix domain-containing protein [Rhodocyclaceae bacterium]|nr:ribbon-helix-helix domain-containing protein [Rhodocyclaceae bacterium]
MADTVRWTIKVSPETDLSLRGFLGAQGMKKGDLSKFVEDAVRWRMLDRTVQAVKDRNQDMPAEVLEAMIDEAVRELRSAKATTAGH